LVKKSNFGKKIEFFVKKHRILVEKTLNFGKKKSNFGKKNRILVKKKSNFGRKLKFWCTDMSADNNRGNEAET